MVEVAVGEGQGLDLGEVHLQGLEVEGDGDGGEAGVEQHGVGLVARPRLDQGRETVLGHHLVRAPFAPLGQLHALHDLVGIQRQQVGAVVHDGGYLYPVHFP